jgi:hypothetical protein
MIVTGKAVPRRSFLKGVGATVALPFLDSMVPAFAAAPKPPVRLAFLYVPNGIDMKNWNVPQEGALPDELPRILKPLEAFRGDMIQIGNLTNNSGRALLDGAGDHGRCAGSYLTGVQVKKTTVDIKASVPATRSSPTRSAIRRVSPRSSSAWTIRARRATAIPGSLGLRLPDAGPGSGAQSAVPVAAGGRRKGRRHSLAGSSAPGPP